MSDDPSNQPTPVAPPRHATLRDWLELARISNLPTVWTNVMVGVACGIAVRVERMHTTIAKGALVIDDHGIDLFVYAKPWILLVVLAISCFYVAGMILNDWMDRSVDSVERPNRPLPSGRIRSSDALAAASVLFAAGLALLFLCEHWRSDHGIRALMLGLILVVVVVGYDATHKLTSVSVLLMGLCRGLVYAIPAVLAASGSQFLFWQHELILIPAGVITAYTVCITIVSRSEVSNVLDLRKWLAVLMPLGVLAMVGVLKPAKMKWWIAVAAFAVSLWLARAVKFVFAKPAKAVPAILTWLSGMCLIDAYFLTLLGYPFAALIAGGCFALTAWGHRKILGT